MTTIGYVRDIGEGCCIDTLIEELEEYGCTQIFADGASYKSRGSRMKAMMGSLREGDVVVVCRLEHLGYSLSDLVDKMRLLKEVDVGFVSIEDGIDTRGDVECVFLHVASVIDDFLRSLARERTRFGMAAARRRGKIAGRKPVDAEKVAAAMRLHESGLYTVAEACAEAGISESTFYRYRRDRRDARRGKTAAAPPDCNGRQTPSQLVIRGCKSDWNE